MNKDIRTKENILFYLKTTLSKKESKLTKLTNKFRTKKVNIKIERLENEIVTLNYIKEFYILPNTDKSKKFVNEEDSSFDYKIASYKYIIKEIIDEVGCIDYDNLKQYLTDKISPTLPEDFFILLLREMVKDNTLNYDNLNDITKCTFTSDKKIKEFEEINTDLIIVDGVVKHNVNTIFDGSNIDENAKTILKYIITKEQMSREQVIDLIIKSKEKNLCLGTDEHTSNFIDFYLKRLYKKNYIFINGYFNSGKIIVNQEYLIKVINSGEINIKDINNKAIDTNNTVNLNSDYTLITEEQELLEYLYIHGELTKEDIKKHFNSLLVSNKNCDIITETLDSLYEKDYIMFINRTDNKYIVNRPYVDSLIFQGVIHLNIVTKSTVLNYINQNKITNIKDIINSLEPIYNTNLEKDYILKFFEDLISEGKIHTISLLNGDINKILYASNDYPKGNPDSLVPILMLIGRISK